MGMDIEIFALYGVCLGDVMEKKTVKVHTKQYSSTTGKRLEDIIHEGTRYYFHGSLIGTYNDVVNWVKSRIDDLKIPPEYKEKLLVVESYSYQSANETFVGVMISDDFYGYPNTLHLEIHDEIDPYFDKILQAIVPGGVPKKYIISSLSI